MPETNITKSDEVEAGNVCTSATEREDIQLLVCMTKPTSWFLNLRRDLLELRVKRLPDIRTVCVPCESSEGRLSWPARSLRSWAAVGPCWWICWRASDLGAGRSQSGWTSVPSAAGRTAAWRDLFKGKRHQDASVPTQRGLWLSRSIHFMLKLGNVCPFFRHFTLLFLSKSCKN